MFCDILVRCVLCCYCNGVQWPSYHRHHYLKRVSTATTLENTMTYFYYIFYNTTSKYINPDTCIVQLKKLVHQSTVHKLLRKNDHEESLITSVVAYFFSFYYPTNQFGIQTYKAPKWKHIQPKSFCTLKFGTKQVNHACLAS